MNQRDIDKLLTCRKAIDDHRGRKAVARSNYAGAATTDKSPAYATMQGALASSKDTYLAVLSENGFETYEDFVRFNERMCLDLINEYRTPVNNCDLCKGYEGKPPCQSYWAGSDSCYAKGVKQPLAQAARYMYDMYLCGNSCTSVKDGLFEVNTPTGIRIATIKDGKISDCPNMQVYYKWEVTDDKLPFAVGWR